MSLRIGVTCYPSVGGSGVIAAELGKMLAEKGHTVHFITSALPFRLNPLPERVHFHQVNVNQYSVFQYSPYDVALASKMAEVIKREQLDILHVHYAVPHAVCAILAKQMAGTGVKIITTLHGTDITVLGYDPTLAEAIKFGIEQSDGVTAVSAALAGQTYELLSPDQDISVIPNFVDERVYRKVDSALMRAELGIEDDEKVFIHVSNFRPVKRVQDVVSSFERISKEIPAKLLLIGDGPELTNVKEQAKAAGIEDKVLILGKQDRLERFYSISDLMLLLSEKESFGLVALEAMACGVPCIGTKIGGIPEVVVDGWNGFLCELGDIGCIADRSLQILKDEGLHQSLREHALMTPNEQFNSNSVVAEYEALYEKILKG